MKQIPYFSITVISVYFVTSSDGSNTTSNPIDWICPEGYYGVVRHPYDCQLFYQCSTTEYPLLLTCPNGQYFNTESEYCEIPSRVPDCEGGTPPPISTSPEPSTTNDPANWICPEGYDGLIRHPFDCTSFYFCDSTLGPCLFQCPTPLYYNPITEKCEWPADVSDCVGGSPPPLTSTTSKHLKHGKSLIYGIGDTNNFARTVKQVAKQLRTKATGETYADPNPCQEIKARLKALGTY